MTYTINYSITSISYSDRARTTRVSIVNEDTGEIFIGEAKRNPKDEMDIALATNLATARAVRKAILADLEDSEAHIIDYGDEFNFHN